MMTITVTITDDTTAGQISIDPPDAPTQDVGAALIEALIAVCARGDQRDTFTGAAVCPDDWRVFTGLRS